MNMDRRRVFRQTCSEISAFAPGWNKRRLLLRTHEICAVVRLNSEQGIPMDRRRRIWRPLSATSAARIPPKWPDHRFDLI
jgi:hypothetical protein